MIGSVVIWGPIRILVVGVVAGAGYMAASAVSQPAHAVVCDGLHQQFFNPDTHGRGAKVTSPGMRVSNSNVGCTRESDLYVVNNAGTKQVQVGWYETEVGDFGCTSTTGNPRVERVKYSNGIFTCDRNAHTYADSEIPTNDEFAVHDDNQDGVWEYRRNGNLLGTYDLGTSFVSGFVGAGTLRYTASGDSMYGNFDGLLRMDSSASWTNWSGTIGAGDDPEYISCVHNNTWGEVKTGSCP